MITDTELLMMLAEQRREELRRAMERSRMLMEWRVTAALRRPIRGIVAPLRAARREAGAQ